MKLLIKNNKNDSDQSYNIILGTIKYYLGY